MTKVLVATEKPFAKIAVDGIKEILEKAGYEICFLEKYTDKSELLKAEEDADALIVRSDIVTKDIIEAGKKLKLIVRAGAGYDNIDLEAAKQRSIVAMNTPGQNSNAVAELALGMMVFYARSCFRGEAGTELMGKTLGIHGFGNVGKNVARIAKGFGMVVSAFDPYIQKELIESNHVKYTGSIDELYSTCNYVSIHIPANAETNGSVNFDLMSKMPYNAVLVNTARKEVISEESLLKMFETRKDFGYVTDIEPDCAETIREKYPRRYFFTPKKMGAQTAEANIKAGFAAARQIVNYFEKGDITYKVN